MKHPLLPYIQNKITSKLKVIILFFLCCCLVIAFLWLSNSQSASAKSETVLLQAGVSDTIYHDHNANPTNHAHKLETSDTTLNTSPLSHITQQLLKLLATITIMLIATWLTFRSSHSDPISHEKSKL